MTPANKYFTTGRALLGAASIDKGGLDELVLFDRHSTSALSPVLQVPEYPYVLKAYGLALGETVTLLNYYTVTGRTEPYSYKSHQIVLDMNNTVAVVPFTGAYQLKFSGALGDLHVTATGLKDSVPADTPDVWKRSAASPPNLLFPLSAGVGQSSVVQVVEKPWVFKAYGLQAGEKFVPYNVFGKEQMPYSREQRSFELTQSNTTGVIDLVGSYRFEFVGSSGALLVGQETGVAFLDPFVPQGPAGPAGADGVGADTTVVFPQPLPQSVWRIVHNLNRYPAVTVVDSAGGLCFGAVSYINSNIIDIEFSAPFAGKAYLN